MEENRSLLPKNMRQIGEKEDRIKIYVEDYVCSYFQKLELTTDFWRVGVLLGMHEEREGVPCLFISGAIETRTADFAEGRLKFTDETWSDIFRKMELYFPGMGVCGWFVYEKSGGMVDKLSLKRTHEEAFAQGDKVLLLHDDQDEEAFYMLWKNKLTRMDGYYIYYERNEAMQKYMASSGGSTAERSGGERVIEEFRARMEEKKLEAAAGHWSPPNISEQGWRRMKTAAACSVAAVLLISMVSYRQQLRMLEETISNYVSLEAGTGEAVVVGASVEAQASESAIPETEETSSPEETETAETQSEEQTEENAEVAATASLYHVEFGETLSQICMRIYGSLERLDELCQLNEIRDPDTILDGQVLILP